MKHHRQDRFPADGSQNISTLRIPYFEFRYFKNSSFFPLSEKTPLYSAVIVLLLLSFTPLEDTHK